MTATTTPWAGPGVRGRLASGARHLPRSRSATLAGLAPREALRLATRSALIRSLACYAAVSALLLVVLVAGRPPVPAVGGPGCTDTVRAANPQAGERATRTPTLSIRCSGLPNSSDQ